MAKNSDYQKVEATVAAYHEECLREVTKQVADAIDHYRASENDAFDVEAIIHQYHRAAD